MTTDWWDDPRLGIECYNCGEVPGRMSKGCFACWDVVIPMLQHALEMENQYSSELLWDHLKINPRYTWDKAERKMTENVNRPAWNWRRLLKKTDREERDCER